MKVESLLRREEDSSFFFPLGEIERGGELRRRWRKKVEIIIRTVSSREGLFAREVWLIWQGKRALEFDVC